MPLTGVCLAGKLRPSGRLGARRRQYPLEPQAAEFLKQQTRKNPPDRKFMKISNLTEYHLYGALVVVFVTTQAFCQTTPQFTGVSATDEGNIC
jgi:hypothetical protein